MSAPAVEYVKADMAFRDLVIPLFVEYVNEDPELDALQKASILAACSDWSLSVDTAAKFHSLEVSSND